MRKVIIAAVALVSVVIAAWYLWPPSLFGDPHVEEVQRLVSPDGRAEAIVQLVDGGATTSRGYSIYVVPKEGKPEGEYCTVSFDGPVLASGEYGVVIGWLSPTVLEVGATKARRVFDLRSSVTIHGITYHVQRKS